MLKSAGGLNTLMGKGKKPFTFLAPTNNALAKLGPGTLEKLLQPGNIEMLKSLLANHVLPGKFTQDQITAGGLKDINGKEINLSNTRITETIQTKAGLIQVIDKVLD
ncbi:MAG: fasciclin domain-containing protein, partial [Chitinophagaceae bacterium]